MRLILISYLKKSLTLINKRSIQNHNILIKYTVLDNWEDSLKSVDVLYMTRVQKERFESVEEYQAVKDHFLLSLPQVKTMKKDAIILHPLPRVNEIAPDIDSDPRAQYFQQVKNGLFLRMALLNYIYNS